MDVGAGGHWHVVRWWSVWWQVANGVQVGVGERMGQRMVVCESAGNRWRLGGWSSASRWADDRWRLSQCSPCEGTSDALALGLFRQKNYSLLIVFPNKMF